MYGGFYHEHPNDLQMNCDGILFPDLTPKTGYYELKNAHAPAKIDFPDGLHGGVVLTNRLDFSDLSAYRLRWTLLADGEAREGGECEIPPCAPRDSVAIYPPVPHLEGDAEHVLRIEILTKSATPWADAGEVVATGQSAAKYRAKPVTVQRKPAQCREDSGRVAFLGADFE